MSLYDDYMADCMFAYYNPFGAPCSVWHSKDGDIKVKDMSESHIRACMRIVGEDDKWYRYFQKELNERKKLDKVTAHWDRDGTVVVCSNCGGVSLQGETNYCSNCGAKME